MAPFVQRARAGVAMRISILLFVSSLVLATSVPDHARACGGCFAPPGPTGTVSVVGAHRMALLASPSGSILWDQIEYTGQPEDFVWVLPVSGTPEVEVADNGFFEALVQTTELQLIGPTPPRTSCPPAYCSGGGSGCASPTVASDAGLIALSDAGVVVYHEGVVGPYDTATIGSTDPMALVAWLQAHGYAVPDSMLPTIDHYTSLGMNFVALRLAAMVGIDRMAPVRVAFPGLALTLPLRMVAAGVGADVSLELFVFAEARMETASFPAAEVDRAAITYDWASRTFDYDARFEDALFSGTGTLTNWVTEYAEPVNLFTLAGYRSVSGASIHSAAADVALISGVLPSAFLTRLRTRLRPAELGADLVLQVSAGDDIGPRIFVTNETNRPADVACPANRCGCGLSPGMPPVSLAAVLCGVVAARLVLRRSRRRAR